MICLSGGVKSVCLDLCKSLECVSLDSICLPYTVVKMLLTNYLHLFQTVSNRHTFSFNCILQRSPVDSYNDAAYRMAKDAFRCLQTGSAFSTPKI